MPVFTYISDPPELSTCRLLQEQMHQNAASNAQEIAVYQMGMVERIRSKPDDRPDLPAAVHLVLHFILFIFIDAVFLLFCYLPPIDIHARYLA